MNQAKQALSEPWAPSGSITSRFDNATATIIRKGITLQQIHGTKAAVDFLHDKKIDSEVIKRVLGKRPDDYRHDDLDATRNERPAAGPDAA
ncbi:MAG: hypothetical protein H7244_02010 [Herminiimonas sp.]|nr:hypothetical protein [Herminiimonas sp.]